MPKTFHSPFAISLMRVDCQYIENTKPELRIPDHCTTNANLTSYENCQRAQNSEHEKSAALTVIYTLDLNDPL